MPDHMPSESSVHSGDVEKWIDEELRKAGIDPDSIEVEDEQEEKEE